MKRIILALAVLAGLLILSHHAKAIDPSRIGGKVGVCDPDNPARCLQPNSSGQMQNAVMSASASASITRPNDTSAYTANDVIGAATGASAAIQFTGLGNAAGDFTITSTEIEIDAASVISGETSYNLYLYNATPPSALGDNAAFDIPSGDRASFLGKIALGTPADEGSTLYLRTDGLGIKVKTTSAGVLWGYLVTVGAYTPTANRVYKVTLHGILQ